VGANRLGDSFCLCAQVRSKKGSVTIAYQP
jgi:hypothetical protein